MFASIFSPTPFLYRIYGLFFYLLISVNGYTQDLTLSYRFPAQDWMNEALPIGNGYMGAMFYGGVITDEIQISEKSFWAGGPGSNPAYSGGNKRDSWKYLNEIREHLLAGDKKEAARLAEKYMVGETSPTSGKDQFGDFGGHQGFGSLYVTLEESDSVYQNYHRSLNLQNATGKVVYDVAGAHHQNTYFASYPARLIAYAMKTMPGTSVITASHFILCTPKPQYPPTKRTHSQ